jgi:hypothetical protein
LVDEISSKNTFFGFFMEKKGGCVRVPSTPERRKEVGRVSRKKIMDGRMKCSGSPGENGGSGVGSGMKIERSQASRDFKKIGN